MKKRDASSESKSEFFAVDEDNLLEYLREQPELMYRYSRRLGDAKKDLEEAKGELKVTEAEVKKDIRTNPERYGLKRATDKAVEDEVFLHHAYQDAVTNYNRAKHRVDVLYAAVSALEHRKSALEQMVKLHGQQYFATPRLPDTMSEEARDEYDAAEKKRLRNKGRKGRGSE